MTGIGNNFGPRNLAGDMKKAIDNAKKIDEGKALGEAQEATAADRPQGETDVDKTVTIICGDDDSPQHVFYDGVDNGLVVVLKPDGSLQSFHVDEKQHNQIRDTLNPYTE